MADAMIKLFGVTMAADAAERVTQVINSGHIAQGPIVDEFERALESEFLLGDKARAVTVNSGTSAIHLALVLAGVGPDDDCAVTPMTCAASIVPILHLGARPVWIDVDPQTGLMDPNDLHWRMTKRTRAIVAVDWAGTPCDYAAIHEIANGVPVIQDAAHSFLARGNDTSMIYDAVCDQHLIAHSFQAIKHLTTGDGGALIVPDALAARAKRLRWFGFDRTSSKDFRCAQDLDEAGYKFHMNDIAAAIGLANLRAAVASVWTHREHALEYFQALYGLGPHIELPPFAPGGSAWLFTILVADRLHFQHYMTECGIETSQVHRRNDEHPVFKGAAGLQRTLPGLDEFARRQVSIPVGAHLSAQERHEVIQAVRGYVP